MGQYLKGPAVRCPIHPTGSPPRESRIVEDGWSPQDQCRDSIATQVRP